MPTKPSPRLPRIITAYTRQRLAPLFPPRETERIETYLQSCFRLGTIPPRSARGWSWGAIAGACGVNPEDLRAQRRAVEPILLALVREIERAPQRKPQQEKGERGGTSASSRRTEPAGAHVVEPKRRGRSSAPPLRPGSARPLWDVWDEPDSFCEALDLHMRRHGETSTVLHAAICAPGETLNRSTIAVWRRGANPAH